MDQTLALADVNVSVIDAPTAVANFTATPHRRQSRVLIISSNPRWVDEVIGLVPKSDLELKYQDTADSLSLNEAAADAELVVFVGQAAEATQAPFRTAQGFRKPTLWLPAPEHSAPAEAPKAWQRGVALAMRTALGQLEPAAAVAYTADNDVETEEPSLDTTAGELRQGTRTVRVTPTECNLLQVLLASRGCWIPASELRLRAFGPDHACHDSLIRVHVYKLRRKLSITTAQIRSAKGRGYMFA